MFHAVRCELAKHGIHLGKRIGGGCFGQVFAISEFLKQKDLCIKVIPYGDQLNNETEMEYKTLCAYRRAMPEKYKFLAVEPIGLVQFRIPDPEHPRNKMNCYGIIMEQLIPLKKIPKPYSPEFVKQFLIDGLIGLEVLHRSLHVIHLDLKPMNFCLRKHKGKYRAVLIDFGKSYQLNDDLTAEIHLVSRGNLMTKAPEMIFTGKAQYSTKCDIYSMAALIRVMIVGKYELDTPQKPTAKELWEAKKKLAPISNQAGYSPALLNILNRMMAFQPEPRFSTCAEALRAVITTLNAEQQIESSLLDTVNEMEGIPLTVIAVEAGSVLRKAMPVVTETLNQVLHRSRNKGNVMLYTYSDTIYLLRDATPIKKLMPISPVKSFGYTDLGNSVSTLLEHLNRFRQVFGYNPDLRLLFIGTGDSMKPPFCTSEQQMAIEQSKRDAAFDVARFVCGTVSSITLGKGDFQEVGISNNVSVATEQDLAAALKNFLKRKKVPA